MRISESSQAPFLPSLDFLIPAPECRSGTCPAYEAEERYPHDE